MYGILASPVPGRFMVPLHNNSGDIQKTLAEVTGATTEWMRLNVLNEDYGSMQPLIEHAITSVVPASDRAILVRYGCELMGKDWHEALPGMAAFEFQNINLLVTDDYFDDRRTSRMGDITISEKWGPKAAVALGFVLKSLSNEALILGWKNDGSWNLNDAVRTIEWASKWQYYSQFLEDELCNMPISEISFDHYRNLIEKATAVGIAGAIELGCIIGGCDVIIKNRARDFGIRLGCLLQIRDDCIDYIFNEDLIHKGPFSDLLTRRKRLPILAAYWCGTAAAKKKIEHILTKKDLSLRDAYAVTEIILAPRVQSQIRNYSLELADQAIAILGLLPQDELVQDHFKELISLFLDL